MSIAQLVEHMTLYQRKLIKSTTYRYDPSESETQLSCYHVGESSSLSGHTNFARLVLMVSSTSRFHAKGRIRVSHLARHSSVDNWFQSLELQIRRSVRSNRTRRAEYL